jgi:hypothetical protein
LCPHRPFIFSFYFPSHPGALPEERENIYPESESVYPIIHPGVGGTISNLSAVAEPRVRCFSIFSFSKRLVHGNPGKRKARNVYFFGGEEGKGGFGFSPKTGKR